LFITQTSWVRLQKRVQVWMMKIGQSLGRITFVLPLRRLSVNLNSLGGKIAELD
jgi:hypothetical protein